MKNSSFSGSLGFTPAPTNFPLSPHEAYGLCALWLPQFKAAGLVVVFDHNGPHLLSGEPYYCTITIKNLNYCN